MAVSEARKVWYWNRAYPILDARGALEHVVIQHTDATKIKEAEAALRRSEARYRVLTESIKDVVWIIDAETLRYLRLSTAYQSRTADAIGLV